jgi:hypothetical protein
MDEKGVGGRMRRRNGRRGGEMSGQEAERGNKVISG